MAAEVDDCEGVIIELATENTQMRMCGVFGTDHTMIEFDKV